VPDCKSDHVNFKLTFAANAPPTLKMSVQGILKLGSKTVPLTSCLTGLESAV
jgi:hypothetical protein